MHKRLSGINSHVGYAVLSFYPKHDPVAGGGKSIDFCFPYLEITPRIHSHRENCQTGGVEQHHFRRGG